MIGHAHIVSWALCLAILLPGCTEEVAAPLGKDEPFSMYGILIPSREFQTISVSPIQPLLFDYPAALDATVSSTDLETGQKVIWKDSVSTGDRGQREHVFWAEFVPEFGHAYKVEAVRSDGATTSAVAHIPERVVVDARGDADDNLQVLVSGKAFRLNRIELIYQLRLTERSDPNPCLWRPFTHVVSYTGEEYPVENGYGFDVNLGLDHFNMELFYVRTPNVHGLALMGLSVRMLVADPAWNPPGGEFDANTLSHPDVMTNTTNGFGLVAGGYEYRRAAYPSEEVIAGTKFFDFMIRPPSDCFDYCSCG